MSKDFTKNRGMDRPVGCGLLILLFFCSLGNSARGQCTSTITGLQLVSQTTDSANFSWDPLTEPYGYLYYIDSIPVVNPGNIQSATSNTLSVLGLCGGKTYYLFVSGQCAGQTVPTWDTIHFVKQCTVIPSSLSGTLPGVYCDYCQVNIGMPSVEVSQDYTWTVNGNAVVTKKVTDPTAGGGGGLSYQLTVRSRSQDGIYSIVTKPLCGTCSGTDSVQFGAFPVYIDSIIGLHKTVVTDSSVSFQWDPIVSGETYTYWVTTDAGGAQQIQHTDTTQNAYGAITGLQPGTTYYIWVSAQANSGNGVLGYYNSVELAITTLPANHTCAVKADTLTGAGVYCPGSPLMLKIPATQANQSYILLRNGQRVDSAQGNGGLVSFSYLMQASLAGTYTVLTNDTCNCCTALPFGSAVVGYDSVSGLGLAASPTSNSVSFRWNSIAPGVTYRYGVSTSATTPPAGANITTTTATSATIPGLNAGTTYYLFVDGQCNNGVGATTPGPWDTLSFATSAAVAHTCDVQAGTLTGGGVYCPGNTVTLTVPQSLTNQSYTFLLNGTPVDSMRGNGASLSYSFLMKAAALAGTYTVRTNDTCRCCTAQTFGSAVVSYDSVTGLTTAGITTASVVFRWNSLAPGATYQYGISESVNTPPTRFTPTVSTSASVNALNPGTTYYIYVSALCDNGIGATGYGNPAIDSFKTSTSTNPPCNVQTGSLAGGGVYCPGNPVNLSVSVALTSQTYSILQNGVSVYTARGNGSILTYSFPMKAASLAGTYTVLTNDTCNCCTPATFGSVVVAYDSITGLMVDSTTTASISFHWNSLAPGAIYEIGYSISADQPPTSFTATTDTHATIGGLSPGTTYFIFVKAQCDNGIGSTGSGNPGILSGRTSNSPTHTCNVQQGTMAGGGVFCPGSPVSITIPVTVTSQTYTIYDQHVQPVYTATGNGGALTYTFTLQSASQAGVYIGSTTDTCGCCGSFDLGYVAIVYDSITGLKATGTTSSTVNFQWDSIAQGTVYRYGISPVAAAAPPTYAVTTATSATITGLTPGAGYYLFVAGQCNNGVGATTPGAWDTLYFVAKADTGATPPTGCDTVPTPVVKLFSGILGSSSLVGNQWFLNDTLIPGATGYGYTPTSSGSYSVRVSIDSCVKMSAPLLVNGPQLTTPNVRIFPNPATTTITVDNLGPNPITVQLYDLAGRPISGIQGVRGSYELGCGNLARGPYLIKVTDEKTKKKMERMIMKM
ncbi:MAG: fibronectin type III domain-containing protein [Puia sp.]|nr:fibronectin type III domain-containing protein [Puia sp.]